MTLFSGNELFPAAPVRVPRVLEREAEALIIVNSAAETTLYSFTVPGATLVKDEAIRFMVLGDILNNSAGTPTLNLRVKFGGTTLFEDLTAGIPIVATRRGFLADLVLCAKGDPDSQFLYGRVRIGDPTAPTSGDFGHIATDELLAHDLIGAAGAIDARRSQLFDVTVQFSAGDANTDIRRRYANAVLL
jgi:hypothetical protein